MRVLGLDPGGKTGWAVYCTRARAVVQSGVCEGAMLPWGDVVQVDAIAVERPEAYGAARPQVVDCAWIAGVLYAQGLAAAPVVVTLYRRQVVKEVGKALGATVRGDAEVWRALCEMHGPDADKRASKTTAGGPLSGCISHSKAAVAVAWAAAQTFGWRDE